MAEIAKEMDQMRSVRKEVLKQLYSYMQKAKDISIDIECSVRETCFPLFFHFFTLFSPHLCCHELVSTGLCARG